MGGGNGLKSHMARERNASKMAAEGKGGGGAAGIKMRTESKSAVLCALCKTPFTNSKMIVQLRDHAEAKHPRNSLMECFPDITF
jgi:hypothetical protein